MSQTQTLIGAKRIRKYFGKITEQAEMPNLIEVQKESYAQFLQMQKPEGGRADEGLQAVFHVLFCLLAGFRDVCERDDAPL